MNLNKKSSNSQIFPPFKQPQLDLHQAFTNLQTHCSGLLHNLSHHFPSLNTHFQSTLSDLHGHAKYALESGISNLNSAVSSSCQNPVWARIADMPAKPLAGASLSTEAIEERLAGVPVYALSNSAEEFVLVSGVSSRKSLGLFCFKKEDAEALLEQIRSMDPSMQNGSKVVPVALNKIFQLKVDGVAFRLIPDCSQVKNALKEREKVGFTADVFSGVPVFQSRSLILRSQQKSYRPAFFRREDLENSLQRASNDQNQLNPALRAGDIQVAVLEDVIKGMKENSTSTWNDVVFIPPGFDVSTDPTKR